MMHALNPSLMDVRRVPSGTPRRCCWNKLQFRCSPASLMSTFLKQAYIWKEGAMWSGWSSAVQNQLTHHRQFSRCLFTSLPLTREPQGMCWPQGASLQPLIVIPISVPIVVLILVPIFSTAFPPRLHKITGGHSHWRLESQGSRWFIQNEQRLWCGPQIPNHDSIKLSPCLEAEPITAPCFWLSVRHLGPSWHLHGKQSKYHTNNAKQTCAELQ